MVRGRGAQSSTARESVSRPPHVVLVASHLDRRRRRRYVAPYFKKAMRPVHVGDVLTIAPGAGTDAAAAGAKPIEFVVSRIVVDAAAAAAHSLSSWRLE